LEAVYDTPRRNLIVSHHRDLLARVRVLVVEDQDDMRYVIDALLRGAGADVTSVSNARQALRILGESAPDVLVSDIVMPDRDGLWLIREMRSLEAGRSIPAVAVTSLLGADDRRRILAAGYTAIVPKPAVADDLVLTVHRLARRNGANV
jgi:CheY-like chemotaxis protein